MSSARSATAAADQMAAAEQMPAASRPVVHLVGLGPGDPSMVTAGTIELIAAVPIRFVRTLRHPSVTVLGDVVSFDDHYDRAEVITDVYARIAADVADAAIEHGEVLYAVPGSPVVAETSVSLLIADRRVDTVVHPAMSFLDLTWARLGIDPVELGVLLVDGHRVAEEVAGQPGPFLVGQCDSRFVMSNVKLAFDDHPDPDVLDTEVIVLQRLGLPDERVAAMALADIDREVDPDHLTSVWIPALGDSGAAAFTRVAELMHLLREQDAWKAEQTHDSLKRYLLEEAYEVFEAIDAYDPDSGEGADELRSELGDLLYQVVFHSALGAEAGWFTLTDVATDLHDKLVRRHPQLLGDVGPSGQDVAALVAEWESGKVAEQHRASAFDGIPSAMPALARALKVAKRAEAVPELAAAVAAAERDGPLDGPVDGVPDERQLGEQLLALTDLAHRAGLDPEDSLRRATGRRLDALRSLEAGDDGRPR